MPELTNLFLARVDRETERENGPFIDGDTFILECALCHEPRLKQGEVRIRLLGVDCPEVTGPTREEGLKATEFTKQWLENAEIGPWSLMVQTTKKDSFGRWLSKIWNRNTGECLNDTLVRSGHGAAVPIMRHLRR
jgi:endonuclease YncB( thermonuclease family)